MPLSEHEQRILDEIEEGLGAREAGVAQRVKESAAYQEEKRNARWAIPLAVVGFAVIIASLWSGIYLIGVAGFLITVYAILVVVNGLGRVRQVAQDSIKEKVESWSLRQIFSDGQGPSRPSEQHDPGE
ncbi:MAG: hypothetical protein DCC49_10020 [Acidobacteria bacterium]|nr:MAG: hypothetical protein DCC49_10020 [Acidobacteriota bacterium]